MTIHATTRTEFVHARLSIHLSALSLPGSPAFSLAEEHRRSAESSPFWRVSFRELPPVQMGRFNATQTAHTMALLVIADLFWPESSTDLSAVQRAASELRGNLQYRSWTFLDYTVPASPVVVADALILVRQPVEIRQLPKSDGYRRRQVRATAEWVGRFEDFYA